MQRGRRANQPSIPQTTEETKRLLQQYPVYRLVPLFFCKPFDALLNLDLLFINHTINGTSLFFHGRVSSATGSALIFLSLAVLSEIRFTSQILSDGTFYSVPNLFYQLFTIHIMYNGKVSLVFNKTIEHK